MSFVWEHGGDIATQEGDQWVGQLDSPESIAGLEFFKELFDTANAAPADGDDANDCLAFCAGEVGMMPAPGWKPGQIINPDDGCPDMEANIGVFAMPGIDGRHDRAGVPRRLEPGIPANSENQELAYDLLKVLVSSGFQKQFAEQRHDPGAQVRAGERRGQRRRRGPGRGRREQPLRADQREVGRASRRPTSCRTCSPRSPRATTSPRPRRRPTRRSRTTLNG